jgi:ADP-ribose pyrophosphatase YjhB (NUDIX family)
MQIAIAKTDIADRGRPYVPEMRKHVGHSLIAVPGARAVIRRRIGKDILLHRRLDFGVWALPAGSPEIGESIVDCMRREVFEETDLKVAAYRCFGFSSDPEREIVRYPNGDVLHCYSLLFEVELEDEALDRVDMEKIAAETTALKWFALNDLPEMIDNHRCTVESYIGFRSDGVFRVS